MKLIVGLGNIGEKYKNTNHNVGFMVLDLLAEKLGLKFNKTGCEADYAEKNIEGEHCIFAKPRTYMNESGRAVKSLVKKYKISLNDVLIISDDIDLEPGRIRVKPDGSAGTHNGLKSIIAELNSTDFARVRVGIGKQAEHQDLADFVLSKMKLTDVQKSGLQKAADATCKFVSGSDVDKIMNEFNG